MTFIEEVVDAVMEAAQRGDRETVSTLMYRMVADHLRGSTLGRVRAFMAKRGSKAESSAAALDEYVQELIAEKRT